MSEDSMDQAYLDEDRLDEDRTSEGLAVEGHANENPVDLFGMYVAHVGINAEDPQQARQIAERFSLLMGLPASELPVSYFSGTLVETMKQNGRGTHGHIGFGVNDIVAAEAWFAARGFEVNEDSRVLNEDGSTRLVYFKEEIGGFAIHLCRG